MISKAEITALRDEQLFDAIVDLQRQRLAGLPISERYQTWLMAESEQRPDDIYATACEKAATFLHQSLFNESRIINIDDVTSPEIEAILTRLRTENPYSAGLTMVESVRDFIKVSEEEIFATETVGNSMNGIGICHGDLLICIKTSECQNRDVVVVGINGEIFVKRFLTDRFGAYLYSENPDYPIRRLSSNDEFKILGKVLRVVKPVV